MDQIIDILQLIVLKNDEFKPEEKDQLGFRLEAMREIEDPDLEASLGKLAEEAKVNPTAIRDFVSKTEEMLKKFYQNPGQNVEKFLEEEIKAASQE